MSKALCRGRRLWSWALNHAGARWASRRVGLALKRTRVAQSLLVRWEGILKQSVRVFHRWHNAGASRLLTRFAIVLSHPSLSVGDFDSASCIFAQWARRRRVLL